MAVAAAACTLALAACAAEPDPGARGVTGGSQTRAAGVTGGSQSVYPK